MLKHINYNIMKSNKLLHLHADVDFKPSYAFFCLLLTTTGCQSCITPPSEFSQATSKYHSKSAQQCFSSRGIAEGAISSFKPVIVKLNSRSYQHHHRQWYELVLSSDYSCLPKTIWHSFICVNIALPWEYSNKQETLVMRCIRMR